MPSNVSGAVEKPYNSCTQACSNIKDCRRRRQGAGGKIGKIAKIGHNWVDNRP